MFPACYRVAGDHGHICESLEPSAGGVLPEFKEEGDERERGKHESLAPRSSGRWSASGSARSPTTKLLEVQAYGRPMSKSDWPAVVAAGGIPIPTGRDA